MLNKDKMIHYAHHALNGALLLFHLYINYLNFYNCTLHINLNYNF